MAVDRLTAEAERQWMEGWDRGPDRTRWTDIPLQRGDRAPSQELLNSKGQPVQLADFWQAGPALLLFWRHYGCGCGMERAERLQDEIRDYRDARAKVVIIGQAGPERSARYSEKHGLDQLPVLCDQEYSLYEAYDLLEGTLVQVLYDAPDVFLRRQREAAVELVQSRRKKGRPLVDNGWLLPGEFVIDEQGIVRFGYRYQYCDNFPDPRVLTAAIREANGDFE